MTDEEVVNDALWKVANAARRETAEQIAKALLECRELHWQDRERAAAIARGIGAREMS